MSIRIVRPRQVAVLAVLVAAMGTMVPVPATAASAGMPSDQAQTNSQTLPPECHVLVGEPGGLAYLYQDRASTYFKLPFPKGRIPHTWISNPLSGKTDKNYYLGISADGRVYQAGIDFGVYGDESDLSLLGTSITSGGRTEKDLRDLAVGAERGWSPSTVVYAVTSKGALLRLPLTYSKRGLPILGRAKPVTAKGLSSLRGIELLGHEYKAEKVTQDILWGHTKDGRLIELRISRTAGTRTVVRVIASTGWLNVAALGIGWCQDRPDAAVILAIDTTKRVRAFLDPKWTDSSLSGASAIELAPWTRSPVTMLF